MGLWFLFLFKEVSCRYFSEKRTFVICWICFIKLLLKNTCTSISSHLMSTCTFIWSHFSWTHEEYLYFHLVSFFMNSWWVPVLSFGLIFHELMMSTCPFFGLIFHELRMSTCTFIWSHFSWTHDEYLSFLWSHFSWTHDYLHFHLVSFFMNSWRVPVLSFGLIFHELMMSTCPFFGLIFHELTMSTCTFIWSHFSWTHDEYLSFLWSHFSWTRNEYLYFHLVSSFFRPLMMSTCIFIGSFLMSTCIFTVTSGENLLFVRPFEKRDVLCYGVWCPSVRLSVNFFVSV